MGSAPAHAQIRNQPLESAAAAQHMAADKTQGQGGGGEGGQGGSSHEMHLRAHTEQTVQPQEPHAQQLEACGQKPYHNCQVVEHMASDGAVSAQSAPFVAGMLSFRLGQSTEAYTLSSAVGCHCISTGSVQDWQAGNSAVGLSQTKRECSPGRSASLADRHFAVVTL